MLMNRTEFLKLKIATTLVILKMNLQWVETFSEDAFLGVFPCVFSPRPVQQAPPSRPVHLLRTFHLLWLPTSIPATRSRSRARPLRAWAPSQSGGSLEDGSRHLCVIACVLGSARSVVLGVCLVGSVFPSWISLYSGRSRICV